MWISVVGATGTGKNEIKDLLLKEDYEYLPIKYPTLDEPVARQFDFLVQRLAVHLKAQSLMDRYDIVTIGSVWDSFAIHFQRLLDQKLVPSEYVTLSKSIEANILPQLKPPHAVVWTYTEQMTAFNRMQLRGGLTVTPAEYNAQLSLYKDFAMKVKVPLVEVDFGQSMEHITKDFIFNLASLRTTSVTAQSLWQREFLK